MEYRANIKAMLLEQPDLRDQEGKHRSYTTTKKHTIFNEQRREGNENIEIFMQNIPRGCFHLFRFARYMMYFGYYEYIRNIHLHTSHLPLHNKFNFPSFVFKYSLTFVLVLWV